jgi:DNA mismatch repair protein MSH5
LRSALASHMPHSHTSSQRGRGTSTRGTSRYRRQSTTSSHSSRPLSNNARPSNHWQSEPNQRRVTINPRPSTETPRTPHTVTPDACRRVRVTPARTDAPEELLDHVIVAIDVKEKGSVGCAYYIAREERLLCMEDVPRGGIESIERCMLAKLQLSMAPLTQRSES